MSLVIQHPAIGILGVIGCFVAIVGTTAVSIVSARSRNAFVFQDQHRTSKAFAGPVTHITGHIVSL